MRHAYYKTCKYLDWSGSTRSNPALEASAVCKSVWKRLDLEAHMSACSGTHIFGPRALGINKSGHGLVRWSLSLSRWTVGLPITTQCAFRIGCTPDIWDSVSDKETISTWVKSGSSLKCKFQGRWRTSTGPGNLVAVRDLVPQSLSTLRLSDRSERRICAKTCLGRFTEKVLRLFQVRHIFIWQLQ